MDPNGADPLTKTKLGDRYIHHVDVEFTLRSISHQAILYLVVIRLAFVDSSPIAYHTHLLSYLLFERSELEEEFVAEA